MKELNPFSINSKTKPSFESDVAKWYLIKRGEKVSLWRWDSKKDDMDKEYIITNNKTNKPINANHRLEDILIRFDIHERFTDETRKDRNE